MRTITNTELRSAVRACYDAGRLIAQDGPEYHGDFRNANGRRCALGAAMTEDELARTGIFGFRRAGVAFADPDFAEELLIAHEMWRRQAMSGDSVKCELEFLTILARGD